MFRINQVIQCSILSIAVASAVGCATAATGGDARRDVHASARVAGAAARVLVKGPALLMHVDVEGRADVSLYAVHRNAGTEADCAAGPIGAPRHLRPGAPNLVNLTVPADQTICVAAAPSARSASIMWHARRIEAGAPIDRGEAIALDEPRR